MAIFKLPRFAWFTGVMSLLGTMADALDGNASCGWVACRSLSMSLGGQPCSWSSWGVSSVRSCASWTRSSATALDKSARLCVFSHVSTSANVMAQGWKVSISSVLCFLSVVCDELLSLVGLV